MLVVDGGWLVFRAPAARVGRWRSCS